MVIALYPTKHTPPPPRPAPPSSSSSHRIPGGTVTSTAFNWFSAGAKALAATGTGAGGAGERGSGAGGGGGGGREDELSAEELGPVWEGWSVEIELSSDQSRRGVGEESQYQPPETLATRSLSHWLCS